MEQPDYRPITRDALKAEDDFDTVRFTADVSLDGGTFTDRTFTRCLFETPLVRDADFSGARFKDCTFLPMRFANGKFIDTHVENCTFFTAERKEGCIFAFCDMRSLGAARCNFAGCSFERSDLYNLKAVDCSFRGAKFKGSGFHRSISRKVVRTVARFDSCNLSFADMSALSLQGCEMPGCKLSETLFFDADLTDAVLTNTIIDRAEWDRANLKGADLRGASISGLNIALLTDYTGLSVSESQQDALLEALGIKVWPG